MLEPLLATKKRDEVTIKMSRQIYEDLQEVVNDVKNTVARLAENYSAKEKYMNQYPPYMQLVAVKDNSMWIKDDKRNMTAEVKLQYVDDKSDKVVLMCLACKSDDCTHVAFALGCDELGQLHLNLKNKK